MERSPKLYSQLTDYSNNPNVIQSCINELNNNFTNPLHSNKVTTLIDYSQHQLFNKLVVCMNNKEINDFKILQERWLKNDFYFKLNKRNKPRQRLCNYRSGLYHGVRHCKNAEFCAR